MCPYIHIFGAKLPMYGLMMMTGAFLAMFFACLRGKKKGFYPLDILLCAIFAFLGGLLGAKILYFITNIPDMVEYFKTFGFSWKELGSRFINSGIVFYGGLIGGFIGGFAYTKLFRLDFWTTADTVIPFLPLAHGFGRIGCFCAGCCYGREVDPPWGILVTSELSYAQGTYRLPVQLFETCFDIVLLLPILLLYSRKERKKGQVVGLYAICYGVFRFINEYFRDDEIRGIFGAFSTSQWISLALVPIGIFLMTGYLEKLFPKRLGSPYLYPVGYVIDGEVEEYDEQAEPEQTESEQAEPEQTESEQAEPDGLTETQEASDTEKTE